MLNLIVIEIKENTIAPDMIFEQRSFILKRRIFDTIRIGSDFSKQYDIERKTSSKNPEKRMTFSKFNSKIYKYKSISIEMSYFL